MASKSAPSPPPYPSAARISDSECYPQYSASLKCLEEYSKDKSKCQGQFDNYKECKKREVNYVTQYDPNMWILKVMNREARLERNKTRSLFG